MNISLLGKIVHDMKQPLDNIDAVISVAKTMTDDAVAQRFFSMIEENCLYAKRITNNIYDLAYLEENTPSVQYSSRSVAEYVDLYIERTRPFLSVNEIKLETEVNVEKDAFVCDYEMLSKILNNLVGNAVKYNDKKEKKIKLLVNQDGEKYIFSVQDNGIGIPKDELSHITQCYYRATNAKKVSADGCGLGLNITADLVKALNAKMDIESTVGVGSKFIITIPQGTITTLESADFVLKALEKGALAEVFSSPKAL